MSWLRPKLCLVFLLIAAGIASSHSDSDPLVEHFNLQMQVPFDNPTTNAKARLGELLFGEKELSGSGHVSCASCHSPSHSFSQPTRFSSGSNGRISARNTPSLLDVGFFSSLTWDGRVSGLEAQAKYPLTGHSEMDASLPQIVQRLSDNPRYPPQFQRAYGDKKINADRITKALATYQRTLTTPVTPFDIQFASGQASKPNSAIQRGWRIFERHCLRCHQYDENNHLFSDFTYKNTGVETYREAPDLGRFYYSGNIDDRGRFRTPSLRNVSNTAPYMHDGSIESLEDVIEHYRDHSQRKEIPELNIHPIVIGTKDAEDLLVFLNAI